MSAATETREGGDMHRRSQRRTIGSFGVAAAAPSSSPAIEPTEGSMSSSIHMPTRITSCLLVVAVLAACANDDANQAAAGQDVSQFVGQAAGSASNVSSSSDVQLGPPPVSATNVDPCTFFSKVELESAFGATFRPPRKGLDAPSCKSYSATVGTVTWYAGEQIPRARFDSLYTLIGPEAEPLNGVGEAAYFWGPKLYVFNNGRQLVINVSALIPTGELTPQLRTALTSLGRLGAPRLRP